MLQHYHRNDGGWDDGLEVVITGAVGMHLIPEPSEDPLGLQGFSAPTELSPVRTSNCWSYRPYALAPFRHLLAAIYIVC